MCFNRPESSTVNRIVDLIDAGMAIVRFNMSEGTKKVSTVIPKPVSLGQRHLDQEVP
jgi:pyruvate kinase